MVNQNRSEIELRLLAFIDEAEQAGPSQITQHDECVHCKSQVSAEMLNIRFAQVKHVQCWNCGRFTFVRKAASRG